jgi:drug/metabolite transporter (DMT)-like permease
MSGDWLFRAHAHQGDEPRRAMALAAGFAFAWVLLEEVVARRLEGRYDLMQIVWCRYAAHLTTLLLLWGWHRTGSMWRSKRPVFQLARSLLMLVMPASFALAVQSGTPASLVWSVFWISPLLILALVGWWHGDRASWVQWLAAMLGSAATVVVLRPVPLASASMLLLPIVMAGSFAVYVVMTRSLRDEPLWTNLFYTAMGVFLALTPWVSGVWVTPSPSDALLLFAIGAVGLMALAALDRSAACAPVSSGAPLLYIHLPCMVAVASVVHGGPLSGGTALVSALLAAMLFLVWLRAPAHSGARG